jgi:hypothetical protein
MLRYPLSAKYWRFSFVGLFVTCARGFFPRTRRKTFPKFLCDLKLRAKFQNPFCCNAPNGPKLSLLVNFLKKYVSLGPKLGSRTFLSFWNPALRIKSVEFTPVCYSFPPFPSKISLITCCFNTCPFGWPAHCNVSQLNIESWAWLILFRFFKI